MPRGDVVVPTMHGRSRIPPVAVVQENEVQGSGLLRIRYNSNLGFIHQITIPSFYVRYTGHNVNTGNVLGNLVGDNIQRQQEAPLP